MTQLDENLFVLVIVLDLVSIGCQCTTGIYGLDISDCFDALPRSNIKVLLACLYLYGISIFILARQSEIKVI